jgi:hypothetical protein
MNKYISKLPPLIAVQSSPTKRLEFWKIMFLEEEISKASVFLGRLLLVETVFK